MKVITQNKLSCWFQLLYLFSRKTIFLCWTLFLKIKRNFFGADSEKIWIECDYTYPLWSAGLARAKRALAESFGDLFCKNIVACTEGLCKFLAWLGFERFESAWLCLLSLFTSFLIPLMYLFADSSFCMLLSPWLIAGSLYSKLSSCCYCISLSWNFWSSTSSCKLDYTACFPFFCSSIETLLASSSMCD